MMRAIKYCAAARDSRPRPARFYSAPVKRSTFDGNRRLQKRLFGMDERRDAGAQRRSDLRLSRRKVALLEWVLPQVVQALEATGEIVNVFVAIVGDAKLITGKIRQQIDAPRMIGTEKARPLPVGR